MKILSTQFVNDSKQCCTYNCGIFFIAMLTAERVAGKYETEPSVCFSFSTLI